MTRLTLEIKLRIYLILLTVGALALLTAMLSPPIHAIYKDRVRDTLTRLASVAALQIDGDMHATLTQPEHEGSADYMTLRSRLQAVLAADSGLRFAYTMRVQPDGSIHFVVDAAAPEEIAHLGEVYSTAGPVLLAQARQLSAPMAEQDFYTDKWGTFLTAYAPIRRSDGSIDGILGLDMEAGLVTAEGKPLITALLSVFLVCSALAWFLGRMAGRRLFAPIAALTQGAQTLAAGHLKHRITILGDDELAKVGHAFNAMADHLERSQQALNTRVENTSSELERASGLMQTIVENAMEAIIAIDERGIIQSYNSAAERLFGYSTRDCIGNHIQILLPAAWSNTKPEQVVAFLRELNHRPTPARREAMIVHRDGLEIPIEISLGCVPLKSGQLYIGVIYDLSERHKIDRMKKEFIATISHELRTPLTSIRGGIGLVRSGTLGALSDQATHLLRIAEENALHLAQLIDDILDIEKLEAGKLELHNQTVDPIALAHKAIEAMTGYALRYRVHLHAQVPAVSAETQQSLHIDPNRMLQVLNNLLSNAIKFSPENEHVTLAVTRTSTGIRYSISDRGPGIAVEFQSRIFQKFAQADSSDQRQKSGTGLGLSISKQLAEQMGGRIGYTSTPGQGAEFYVDLPWDAGRK